jgi:hypothetical protein
LFGRSTFSSFEGGAEGAGFADSVASVASVAGGGFEAWVLGGVALGADDGPTHERSSAEQAIHREFMGAFW